MNLFPGQLALLNLQGGVEEDERGYMKKKEAISSLQQLSGLCLGDDPAAWEAWVHEHYASFDAMRKRELSGKNE